MGGRALAALALSWLPIACGGRVIGDEPTPDQNSTVDSGAPNHAPSNQATGGAASSGKGGIGELGGTVSLPDCVLGTSQAKIAPADLGMKCPYLYEGRCYTQKLKACACACPNRPGTVCSSGFRSLEGATSVTCR